MKERILIILILISINISSKAQIIFYPEIGYGYSKASASGNNTQYNPLNGKSGTYWHIELLGKFKISPPLLLATGLGYHTYTGGFYSYGGSTNERHTLLSIPVTLDYLLKPQEEKSTFISAGIKYGFSAYNDIKNEFSGNIGAGYKFNRFSTKIFYTTNLNHITKSPNTQNIKFNAIAIALNCKLYAGGNKK